MSAAAHHSATSLLQVGMRRHVSASACLTQDTYRCLVETDQMNVSPPKIYKLSKPSGLRQGIPAGKDLLERPSTRKYFRYFFESKFATLSFPHSYSELSSQS